MELTHFGLRSRPFRNRPDSDCYYPATLHEVAYSNLSQAIQEDEAVVLLTGTPGSGKTLLVQRLIDSLDENNRTILLTQPRLTNRRDLLQAILFDLNLPYQNKTEQELRLALIDSCLQHFQQNGKTILIVDEAQFLLDDHLEELRLLTNLEGKQGRAFQVILVGQPELGKRLHSPNLYLLRQRISIRAEIEPLSPEESLDYLKHQIHVSGGKPDRVFSEEAMQIIVEVSKGIPRLLNQVAYQALVLAYSMETRQVDAEAVLESATRLGLEISPDEEDVIEPVELLEENTPLVEKSINLVNPTALEPTIEVEKPKVLIYSGQPNPTSIEKIEELLRNRRQHGT
jgi:general secretion pathway protein A